VHGSSQLARTLGRGKRLFGDDGSLRGFDLVSSRASTTGALMNVYRAATPRPVGSFARDQPTAGGAGRWPASSEGGTEPMLKW
jgi:hypothetical protein